MAGHVNMMDDCLISNLPPATLRSALRLLISQGAATQRPFVEHVRARFIENPPTFEAPARLFPGKDIVSPECLAYLAQTRCIFSCKLARESLPYLEHFVKAIAQARAKWTEHSDLQALLSTADGDIVQAIQALKESRPEASPELRISLGALLDALDSCERYCDFVLPPLPFPFGRARRQIRDVATILFPDQDQHLGAKIPMYPQDGARHTVETFWLGPFEMPRLFNGLWQLSSPSWGSGSAHAQEKALARAVERGLVASDMADHYGDAELVYGEFRIKQLPEVRDSTYAATKWCIFSPLTEPVTTSFVFDAVHERSRRLRGRVELLQFHWQDYESKEYLDIFVELVRISRYYPELVTSIGLCNFDSEHTEQVCEYLVAKTGDAGIVSNQVQFSLVDARPLQKMVHVCDKYGLKLLTYGSLCGGFLSERWLRQPAPEVYGESNKLTPSQRKYHDMIRTWGTWSEFQTLLERLSTIAAKHGVDIANVATRWVLQQPAVGAVIVGTALGVSDHVDDNLRVFRFELSDGDISSINAIALGPSREKVQAVYEKLGDCGNEYRKMH
ncbi:aldo/keto reductase [Hypoxylon sp. FL0543]|nr:aldo/keto reductase [Hypoxylon sp. FL0543]